MDELTGRWVGMEKQLYAQSFPQGVSLVLYDLTSVYFEGDGPPGSVATATAGTIVPTGRK